MGGVVQGIVYEVLLQRDRKVRRAPRLLREEEVDAFVGVFNRCTHLTGIRAVAKPIHVPLTCLNGDFDGEW
jgi:hypothetical protein